VGANVGAKIVIILQAVDNLIINGISWRCCKTKEPKHPPAYSASLRGIDNIDWNSNGS